MDRYHECKEDCTAAIQQLLADPDPSTLTATTSTVIKLTMRRGAALCFLGLFAEALGDYQQAESRYIQLENRVTNSSEAGSVLLKGVDRDSLRGDVKRLETLCSAGECP